MFNSSDLTNKNVLKWENMETNCYHVKMQATTHQTNVTWKYNQTDSIHTTDNKDITVDRDPT